jgi:hypothetical protein
VSFAATTLRVTSQQVFIILIIIIIIIIIISIIVYFFIDSVRKLLGHLVQGKYAEVGIHENTT